MKKFTLAVMMTLLMASCGQKRISDYANVDVFPLDFQDEDVYLAVKDLDSGLYGIADLDSNIIVPVEFKTIQPVFGDTRINDLFMVMNEKDEYGVMSGAGKTVISPEYQNINYRNWQSKVDNLEGFIVGKKDGDKIYYGTFGLDGKELVPCEFTTVGYVGNGYFKVALFSPDKHFDLKGLYKDGDKVIPCKYRTLDVSHNATGVLAKDDDNDYYLFDLTNGASKTSFTPPSNQVCVTDNYVKANTLYNRLWSEAIYDFSGENIIPFGDYQKVYEHNGYFLCHPYSVGGNSVLLDNKLNVVFNEENVTLEPFEIPGMFKANIKYKDNSYYDRTGIITGEGKWFIPCKYRDFKVTDGKIRAYNDYYERGGYDEYKIK